MSEGPNLQILQQWVGSPTHQEALTYWRQLLIKDVAHLIALPENDLGLAAAHLKVKLRLDLLIDLRLDSIDAQVISKDVVTQFESQLPGRIEYVDHLKAQADAEI